MVQFADQDAVPQRERVEEVCAQAQDRHSQGGVQVISILLNTPKITLPFTRIMHFLVHRAPNTYSLK
jgi:hypothetical protein